MHLVRLTLMFECSFHKSRWLRFPAESSCPRFSDFLYSHETFLFVYPLCGRWHFSSFLVHDGKFNWFKPDTEWWAFLSFSFSKYSCVTPFFVLSCHSDIHIYIPLISSHLFSACVILCLTSAPLLETRRLISSSPLSVNTSSWFGCSVPY